MAGDETAAAAGRTADDLPYPSGAVVAELMLHPDLVGSLLLHNSNASQELINSIPASVAQFAIHPLRMSCKRYSMQHARRARQYIICTSARTANQDPAAVG